MSKLLKLTISRVDGPVFEGDVVSVTVPGVSGEMTLLSEHTPLISPLKQGTISYRMENGSEERIQIAAGTLEVSFNHVTLLI